KKCIGNGCSHVAVIDADEIWDTDFRKLAETLETGAYKLRCKMYVPTIYDDMNIKNPFERMKYCLKKGRTHEEDQCITAWGKVFFNVKDFKNIELGNDKVYFNEKNYETTYIDDVIKHYPNRSLDQYKHKVIISGEAWNANTTKNKNYGWHIRKQYDIYFKGGITALHYHWYEQILEDRRNLMEKVI
ncbi:MAG: hypothetical protein NTW30_05545, partial [Candidatus Aenigmarchaeota archaeon]|nr:hypothetical protein [Candidatus Aenigmarchaeota archaeon]